MSNIIYRLVYEKDSSPDEILYSHPVLSRCEEYRGLVLRDWELDPNCLIIKTYHVSFLEFGEGKYGGL